MLPVSCETAHERQRGGNKYLSSRKGLMPPVSCEIRRTRGVSCITYLASRKGGQAVEGLMSRGAPLLLVSRSPRIYVPPLSGAGGTYPLLSGLVARILSLRGWWRVSSFSMCSRRQALEGSTRRTKGSVSRLFVQAPEGLMERKRLSAVKWGGTGSGGRARVGADPCLD